MNGTTFCERETQPVGRPTRPNLGQLKFKTRVPYKQMYRQLVVNTENKRIGRKLQLISRRRNPARNSFNLDKRYLPLSERYRSIYNLKKQKSEINCRKFIYSLKLQSKVEPTRQFNKQSKQKSQLKYPRIKDDGFQQLAGSRVILVRNSCYKGQVYTKQGKVKLIVWNCQNPEERHSLVLGMRQARGVLQRMGESDLRKLAGLVQIHSSGGETACFLALR